MNAKLLGRRAMQSLHLITATTTRTGDPYER